MLQNGERLTEAAYSRPVDNVVAVYLEKKEKSNQTRENEKLFYCVQTGAFSKKENAEKVLKDVGKFGYNAFITSE